MIFKTKAMHLSLFKVFITFKTMIIHWMESRITGNCLNFEYFFQGYWVEIQNNTGVNSTGWFTEIRQYTAVGIK